MEKIGMTKPKLKKNRITQVLPILKDRRSAQWKTAII